MSKEETKTGKCSNGHEYKFHFTGVVDTSLIGLTCPHCNTEIKEE